MLPEHVDRKKLKENPYPQHSLSSAKWLMEQFPDFLNLAYTEYAIYFKNAAAKMENPRSKTDLIAAAVSYARMALNECKNDPVNWRIYLNCLEQAGGQEAEYERAVFESLKYCPGDLSTALDAMLWAREHGKADEVLDIVLQSPLEDAEKKRVECVRSKNTSSKEITPLHESEMDVLLQNPYEPRTLGSARWLEEHLPAQPFYALMDFTCYYRFAARREEDAEEKALLQEEAIRYARLLVQDNTRIGSNWAILLNVLQEAGRKDEFLAAAEQAVQQSYSHDYGLAHQMMYLANKLGVGEKAWPIIAPWKFSQKEMKSLAKRAGVDSALSSEPEGVVDVLEATNKNAQVVVTNAPANPKMAKWQDLLRQAKQNNDEGQQMEALQELVVLDPEDTKNLAQLYVLAVKAGNLTLARDAAQLHTEADELCVKAWERLARISEQLGDKAAAHKAQLQLEELKKIPNVARS